MRILTMLILFSASVQADDLTLTASTNQKIADAPKPAKVLEVGSFIWVSKPEYDGDILWKISDKDLALITKFPVKPGALMPGRLQGDLRHAAHVVPESKSEVLMLFGEAAGVVTIEAWGATYDDVSKKARAKFLGTVDLPVVNRDGKIVDPEKDKKSGPITKTSAKLQIVMVEETSEANASRVKFFGDEAMLKYLIEMKYPAPVIVDQNGRGGKDEAPPANIKAYIDRVKSTGRKPPQLFIVVDETEPESGKVLFEGDRPSSPEALLTLLKTFAK